MTDIYNEALKKWGLTAQQDVAIEECSELVKEICKLKRGTGDIDRLAEEIADVEIVCDEQAYYYDIRPQIEQIKKLKLERLEGRINDRNNHDYR